MCVYTCVCLHIWVEELGGRHLRYGQVPPAKCVEAKKKGTKMRPWKIPLQKQAKKTRQKANLTSVTEAKK